MRVFKRCRKEVKRKGERGIYLQVAERRTFDYKGQDSGIVSRSQDRVFETEREGESGGSKEKMRFAVIVERDSILKDTINIRVRCKNHTRWKRYDITNTMDETNHNLINDEVAKQIIKLMRRIGNE